jgi:hypothetical protein
MLAHSRASSGDQKVPVLLELVLALSIVFAFTFLVAIVPVILCGNPRRGSRRWRIDQSALFQMLAKVACAAIAAWAKTKL